MLRENLHEETNVISQEYYQELFLKDFGLPFSILNG